ncbi:hypothetical protein HYPSUDRAFT_465656 [Hypholoma sublateritium FD-334 SS-4]|uniref:Amino acid transporter transmembrane domain-containing protein n=1 Tax=Hypholoma sublateritium (strain FD-334 SS-4) TaxID=945553 RepID=A0A0D2MLQ4_HYPSF|nr:hypothetical protein HYPSUDRAFT_465656 [Hypholoma sublateritium FD-334 SS-4]
MLACVVVFSLRACAVCAEGGDREACHAIFMRVQRRIVGRSALGADVERRRIDAARWDAGIESDGARRDGDLRSEGVEVVQRAIRCDVRVGERGERNVCRPSRSRDASSWNVVACGARRKRSADFLDFLICIYGVAPSSMAPFPGLCILASNVSSRRISSTPRRSALDHHARYTPVAGAVLQGCVYGLLKLPALGGRLCVPWIRGGDTQRRCVASGAGLPVRRRPGGGLCVVVAWSRLVLLSSIFVALTFFSYCGLFGTTLGKLVPIHQRPIRFYKVRVPIVMCILSLVYCFEDRDQTHITP